MGLDIRDRLTRIQRGVTTGESYGETQANNDLAELVKSHLESDLDETIYLKLVELYRLVHAVALTYPNGHKQFVIAGYLGTFLTWLDKYENK